MKGVETNMYAHILFASAYFLHKLRKLLEDEEIETFWVTTGKLSSAETRDPSTF